MPLKVVRLRAVAPFRLLVQFNDGTGGTFDCAELVRGRGELVGALRDRDYFGRASLENGVPTWPNFFDISPEWLQAEMLKQGVLSKLRTAP